MPPFYRLCSGGSDTHFVRTVTGSIIEQNDSCFNLDGLEKAIDVSWLWDELPIEGEASALVGDAEPVVAVAMPPLVSDLGRWAESLVQAEAWLLQSPPSSPMRSGTKEQHFLADVEHTSIDVTWLWEDIPDADEDLATQEESVMALATPPLQSDLGRWAERLALAETWLLQNSAPQDLGESRSDGPALTADGCAVDLGGGAPLFFSTCKELSSGFEAKELAKEAYRLKRAKQLASLVCQAESRLEAGDVFCIDMEGTVRGVGTFDGPASTSASLLKRFHWKRRARQLGGAGSQFTLCIDDNNRAMIYVPVPRMRKDAAACTNRMRNVQANPLVLAIGCDGVVMDIPESQSSPGTMPA